MWETDQFGVEMNNFVSKWSYVCQNEHFCLEMTIFLSNDNFCLKITIFVSKWSFLYKDRVIRISIENIINR